MEAGVRDLILKLHEHLDEGSPLDAETRDALRLILADIEAVLGDASPPATPHSEAGPVQHETLAERLRDATWHLEESHPTLTNAVGQLIDALSGPFK